MFKPLAAFWGLGGVCALLMFAIYRLSPYALDIFNYSLSPVQWGALVCCVAFMAYSEGYKGFQKAFSPRVVARAQYLINGDVKPWWRLLAPFFCMSYFASPKQRIIASWALSLMIITFVIGMRYLPQPWRGILDAGVVVGLSWGLLSIAYFCIQAIRGKLNLEVETS